jgi:hypothetical protein
MKQDEANIQPFFVSMTQMVRVTCIRIRQEVPSFALIKRIPRV